MGNGLAEMRCPEMMEWWTSAIPDSCLVAISGWSDERRNLNDGSGVVAPPTTARSLNKRSSRVEYPYPSSELF